MPKLIDTWTDRERIINLLLRARINKNNPALFDLAVDCLAIACESNEVN